MGPQRLQSEHSLVHTVLVDFWSLELGEMSFQCFKLPSGSFQEFLERAVACDLSVTWEA